ncbi:MAG: NRDE family protein [Flavobacterium sp.]|nr:NRDE family protein [Flavobacterium sp.]
MCTVSYIYCNGTSIITSNRDEKVVRPSALAPQEYEWKDKKIVYPKDPQAGGTWYVVSKEGTLIVLLNGAEEKHVAKEQYRKSRGLIVLDVIAADSPLTALEQIDLTDIEPFTLVVFQSGTLFQFRWDEVEKAFTTLDPTQQYIWSSATLYPKEIRDQRSEWFRDFMASHVAIDPEKMVAFHTQTEAENTENGLVINRGDFLKTLSVTQTVFDEEGIQMRYFDLQTQKKTVQQIK